MNAVESNVFTHGTVTAKKNGPPTEAAPAPATALVARREASVRDFMELEVLHATNEGDGVQSATSHVSCLTEDAQETPDRKHERCNQVLAAI